MRRDPLANPEPLIRRVYAYAAYRLGDGPDAEDVTSETFERALRYRASFDPRLGEPVAWLLGIARRCILERTVREQAAPAELYSVPDVAVLEDDAVTRIDLYRAVAALDDRSRELVALKYGAGLAAREIGDLLGLRTNTVEVALHRALRRLEELLTAPAEGSVATPTESPARSESEARAV